MSGKDKIEILKRAVRTYPDFPKEGIIFRDIFGIFDNVEALRTLKEVVLEHASNVDFDIVIGLDSRGFLLGPLISLELGKPFLPIRKKGKLPGHVLQLSYDLEYGQATFEIQTDNVKKGSKVLIVDDLLATGGSMGAAVQLVEKLEAKVVECLVIMELKSLNGRSKVAAHVSSLIEYD